jgi:hypothetical protein
VVEAEAARVGEGRCVYGDGKNIDVGDEAVDARSVLGECCEQRIQGRAYRGAKLALRFGERVEGVVERD